MSTRIMTVSELKVKLTAYKGTLCSSSSAITQHGKPKAVLARYDEYEALTGGL